MFICKACSKAIGPKVRANTVTRFVRQKDYTWVNMDGEVKGATGLEIVSEVKLCPECSGVKAPTAAIVVNNSADARARHSHAGGCKKMLDDCKLCQRNIEAFTQYAPASLNLALTEVPAATFRTSLADACVDALMRRVDHKSRRAQLDFQAGFGVLKGYEGRGGSL